jgi:large subunit ribosomal protein L17
MRHLKKRHKLGRKASHRKAMLANMASSLIKYERIQTTDAKAKALRPYVERLITLGRKGSQHARRLAFSRLRDKEAVTKLFDVVGPRMAERPGGYTRILKLARREGDNAPISLIELVDASLKDILLARGYDEEDAEAVVAATEEAEGGFDDFDADDLGFDPMAEATGDSTAVSEAVAADTVTATEEAAAEEAPAEEAPAEEAPAEEAAAEEAAAEEAAEGDEDASAE